MRRMRQLRGDTRGAYIVEMAIVLPVLLMALLGVLDLSFRMFAQTLLTGAVQKVGRDSTLQGGAQAAAQNDAQVTASVRQLARDAQLSFTRTSTTDYATTAGERFTDADGDGVREPGECFDDVNGNRQWDATVSAEGGGGADDVVRYQVSATYSRIFPLAGLLGWSTTQTISAETLLKNQPFASQNLPTVATICT